MNWYYSAKNDPDGRTSVVLCQECGSKNPRIEVSLSDHGTGYPMSDCEECGREQVVEPHTLVGCGCPSCRVRRMRAAGDSR